MYVSVSTVLFGVSTVLFSVCDCIIDVLSIRIVPLRFTFLFTEF